MCHLSGNPDYSNRASYSNEDDDDDDDTAVRVVHSLQDERQRRQSAAGSMSETSFLTHMLDGLSVHSAVSH